MNNFDAVSAQNQIDLRHIDSSNSKLSRVFQYNILVLGDKKVGKKTFMRQIKYKNGRNKIVESSQLELIEKTVKMMGHDDCKCNLKIWL